MVRPSPAQIILTPTLWHITQSAQTVPVKDTPSSDRFFSAMALANLAIPGDTYIGGSA
jgi:hypothetical protein